ncbi:hypothetical protein HD554DRAFT_2176945 [Boletus coccyginus]|nr:hypothetical protein HD554DRAFT_2176945 [Boletus coccyginus]
MASPAFLMPIHGTPEAPVFDGTSALLPRYFDDINILSNRADLFIARKIRFVIRYADLSEAELWETLPEASAHLPDWDAFILAVKKYYPGCEDTNRYCHTDLIHIVQDRQITPMHSLDDLGEYHRAFLHISPCLIANRRLSEPEHDPLFLIGFPDPVHDHLQHRLTIVKPDVHPDDPYVMEDILEAAKFLLSRSMFRQPPVLQTIPSLPYNKPIPSSVFLISPCEPADTFRHPDILVATNPDPDPLDASDIRDIDSDVFNFDSDNEGISSSDTTADPDFRTYLEEAWLMYQAAKAAAANPVLSGSDPTIATSSSNSFTILQVLLLSANCSGNPEDPDPEPAIASEDTILPLIPLSASPLPFTFDPTTIGSAISSSHFTSSHPEATSAPFPTLFQCPDPSGPPDPPPIFFLPYYKTNSPQIQPIPPTI